MKTILRLLTRGHRPDAPQQFDVRLGRHPPEALRRAPARLQQGVARPQAGVVRAANPGKNSGADPGRDPISVGGQAGQ